ncbi:MAG: hypothetical protein ABIZ69_12440 [Ilumatobacteraceae bacterium]
MKQVRAVLVAVLIAIACSSPVGATVPPIDPSSTAPTADPASTVVLAPVGVGTEVPVVETPPPIVDPLVVSAPLVVIPPGCTAPPAPVVVFVGTLADADATTARYAVQQIRAGSLDGYAVNTIVDVRYDDDIRFLHAGQQYLVGAIPDPLLGRLRSKVRLPAPLFGGDAVIGVNDSDVRCPRVEDGVKTLLADGREVDTGVLAPLKTAKKSVLKAVLKPLVIAFVILVFLASIKLLIVAMVRAARERGDDEQIPFEVQRDRQHAGDDGSSYPSGTTQRSS